MGYESSQKSKVWMDVGSWDRHTWWRSNKDYLRLESNQTSIFVRKNFLTICNKWDSADANGERGRLILIVDCLGPTQERIYSPSQSLLQDITFCSTLESWYQTRQYSLYSHFVFCLLASKLEFLLLNQVKNLALLNCLLC